MSTQGRSADVLLEHDVASLNGSWVVTGAHLAGIRVPVEAWPDLTLYIRNGMFLLGADGGTLAISRHVSPPALDVVATRGPNRGRFVPAIYDHTDGRLRICYDLSGTERPREFKAPAGTRRFLATYRRAEDAR